MPSPPASRLAGHEGIWAANRPFGVHNHGATAARGQEKDPSPSRTGRAAHNGGRAARTGSSLVLFAPITEEEALETGVARRTKGRATDLTFTWKVIAKISRLP